jgi:FkbM family methyltransferase
MKLLNIAPPLPHNTTHHHKKLLFSKIQMIGRTLVRYLQKRNGIFKVFANFIRTVSKQIYQGIFIKRWLRKDRDGYYFDFNGALLPDISSDRMKMGELLSGFEDTFLISCRFNDNYAKSIVELVDQNTPEGPYGYCDGDFDVTVKTGDIVIDAGAWIGDFSAYASSKGAITYAFEPVDEIFCILKNTAKLNKEIYPIQKGLGDSECQMPIYINKNNSAGNSVNPAPYKVIGGMINITTIDKFVEENNIKAIDFIKADIEGAERDMLKGASQTLKRFAPKLAICTYHLSDDPQILEKIILEINPAYTIRHLSHKLFACVINKT